ncbi:MAG: undecaprenyl pyrophosphate synthetase [Actinomycetota bacterium]
MDSASASLPVHIACIMDGNGRWASRRGLPRNEGHTAGEESLARVVRDCAARKISWLTVFGFSTENWVRPRAEVRHILALHRKLFGRLDEMNQNNARTQWIGRPFKEPAARTPVYVQKAIRKAIADTASNTGLVVTVAFDYGSRAELVRASQLAMKLGPVTPQSISEHLYEPSMPNVDILVRTSGEARISNFMLWQIKGATMYFTERAWPDFDGIELDRAIEAYQHDRSR